VRVGPLVQLVLRTMPVFFRRSVGLASLFLQLVGSLGNLLMAGAMRSPCLGEMLLACRNTLRTSSSVKA